MKRTFLLLISALMVSVVSYGGSWGCNGGTFDGTSIEWQIYGDEGTISYRIEVTGAGEIPDFPSDCETPWCGGCGDEVLSIVLDGNITSVGNYTFYNCHNLVQITCNGSEPPMLKENTFNPANYPQYTVIVPYGSSAQYTASPYWSQMNIQESEGGFPDPADDPESNPYTITFIRNGATESTTVSGTDYTLPTAGDEADACDGWAFKGWITSESAFAEGQTSVPEFVTTVSSASTLYAIYGQGEGGGANTETYTFTDKSWGATPTSWMSTKDGSGYSNSGVQVTTSATGAGATCPMSYNNITSIVVSYCTNSSKGAGTIVMDVDGTEVSQTVTTTGGTTARNLAFDFSERRPSGTPKITVNCTTSSIYICGVTINCDAGGSITYMKTPCTMYSITLNNGGIAVGGTFNASATTASSGTVITLTATPEEGYLFSSWNIIGDGNPPTPLGLPTSGDIVTFTMPEQNVTVEATFVEKVYYTVALSRNGVTESLRVSDIYTLPTAADEADACDGWLFRGWIEPGTSFAEGQTFAPEFVTTVSSESNLYAIYGQGEGGVTNTEIFTFTDKSWHATPTNWVPTKEGAGFNNNGIQVTQSATGAAATCPVEYNNITSIIVSYCTNASNGDGTIVMDVNGTELTKSVTKTGGTTPRDLTFDFSGTKPSGMPKITVNCTTNSIYICGVTINNEIGGTITYMKMPCTAYSVTLSREGVTETVSASGTYTLPTAGDEADACNGWSFMGWINSDTPFEEGQTYAPEFENTVSHADLFYAIYGLTSSNAPRRQTMASETWELVTDASTLAVGDVLVIACNSKEATAGDISNGVMASVPSAFSQEGEYTTISLLGDSTIEFTLSGNPGAWVLNSSFGALGSSGAKKLEWNSGTTTWSISIESGNATISSNTSDYGTLLFNASSPRFTTYTTTTSTLMPLPQLYRKTSHTPTAAAYKKNPCTAYTVTLSREDVTETISANGTYTLPTAGEEADACDGWSFRGWMDAGSAFAEGQTLAPEFVTTVNSESTLYAIYGKDSSGGEVKFSKATDVIIGDQLVLVYESGNQELSGFSTSGTIYGTGTSYSTTPTGAYLLEVVPGSSTGTFGLRHEDSYLSWTSNNSLTTSTALSANSSWTITFNESDAVISNASDNTRSIRWNITSTRFACYTSGSQNAVQLYKKEHADATVYMKQPCASTVVDDDSGLIEGDLYWSFDSSTGTLSITGTGAMPDWIAAMAPWSSYVEHITKAYINNGVTYVCNGAFDGCSNITEVTLAETVDSIGSGIFSPNNNPISMYIQRMTPPGVSPNAFINVEGCVYVYCYESAYGAYEEREWDKVCLGFMDDPTPDDPTQQDVQVEIALTDAWKFIMLPSSALAGNWSMDDITTSGEVIWARYDGEKRAAGQSGWTIVDLESSYYKDWGHIVRAQSGTATLTLKISKEANSQSTTSMRLTAYPASLPQNANWNLIGNPYNASYDIKGLLAAGITSPIHVWNGTGYTTYDPEYDDYTLQPFEAFFVQISGTETQSIHLSPEYIVGNGGNGGNTHEQVEGELSGAFSIGESMQVHFSKGNLQYNASSNIWRFAESQYDYIGEENTTNISDPTNGGWIDLFGWGTGDNPTRSTQNGSQYSEFTDWGINPILNGGNIANIWQTLKSDEWTYLLQSRANAQQLQGVATVNGYTGLILLPDNWYDTGHTALVSSYTSGEWETMENAGAVFLPAAGYRWGSTKMFEVGVSGEYWSASFGATDEAYDLDFKSGSVNPMSNYSREYGFSVRLVRQIQ